MLLLPPVYQTPAPKPQLPFRWETPAGWRTETIPFPLDFAPELAHKGFEELRFAPGMFKPEAEDFWSYAFVWWLDSHEPFDAAKLNRELPAYFKGLCMSVGKAKFAMDPARFKARINSVKEGFEGEVDLYDAFKTGQPITLHVKIRIQDCGSHRALLCGLSPKPFGAGPWSSLDPLIGAFGCP